MRLKQVDLNLFVVFDVIYSERNLTRAGEVLCLTQPTVSNALSRLRNTFNDELFVRTPQGMVPTPVTENIIGRVREALQLLGNSVLETDSFEPASSDRVFRVSMNDIMEAMLLPPLMAELRLQAPGMTVESYHRSRRDLGVALSSTQLELAIDIPEAADANLCHQPLLKEHYVCAVREDHPHTGRHLTLKQYLELGHIHVSSRRRGLGFVDMELNKMGLQRNIHLRLEHYLVAPNIVRQTDLALTVPSLWAEMAGLKTLELPLALPELQSHLIWHRSADGDSANRWLREKISALCQ